MLRLVANEFGAPRAAVLKGLQAEGIPCSAGYGWSLHQQPMFRNKAFGPYLPEVSKVLNYRKVSCPNSDLICREQCVWLEQSIFLGTRADMDDIARAFEKVQENRDALNAQEGRKQRSNASKPRIAVNRAREQAKGLATE
jgi:dTDP-4-amino-4,6-dideoxygalactose transaminase